MLKPKISEIKQEFKKEVKHLYPFLIPLTIILITAFVIIKSGKTLEFLSTLNVEDIQNFVGSFGVKAPLIFILLQISQAVIAPIPGFIFTIAGGLIFGALWGSILSIFGSMIGAFLCFLLVKKYGRPFVEKMLKKEDFGLIDSLFEEKGLIVTIILRAIPVMSFGLASYLVSLTSIDLRDYMLGTFLGLIPTTIFYTYLGIYILDNPFFSMIIGLFLLAFLLIIPFTFPMLKNYIKNKKGKKEKITI